MKHAIPTMLLGLALTLAAGCCGDSVPNRPPIETPPDDPGPPADTLAARIAEFQLVPLPRPPYPRNNPRNPIRIDLGRLLFWDPILGGESAPWVKAAAGKDPKRYRASDVACATCHQPQFAFADGRVLAAGVGGGGASETSHPVGLDRVAPSTSIVTGRGVGLVPRNSMTLLNAGLNGRNSITPTPNSFQLMDGITQSGLEFQIFFALTNREEMAGDAYGAPELGSRLEASAIADSIRLRVASIPEYLEMFKAAFPGRISVPNDLRADQIFLSIAAFERELLTPDSRYDRFVSGDFGAFTTREKEGFLTFFGKARCGACHYGPMLSDYTFRVQGTGDAYDRVLPGYGGKNGQGGDWGRWHGLAADTPGRDLSKYHFRVVSLRNVELTAPYFHSGSGRTLGEVIDFYNRGGRGPEDLSDELLNASDILRDDAIVPLGLTEEEIDALIAFLKTTTAAVLPTPEGLDLTLPPTRVPSGLIPPGVTPDADDPDFETTAATR